MEEYIENGCASGGSGRMDYERCTVDERGFCRGKWRISGVSGGEKIMKGRLELPLKVTVAINSSSYHLKGGRKMLYIWY